jgi:hypothetical protein
MGTKAIMDGLFEGRNAGKIGTAVLPLSSI